jgi:tRNA(Ile)-lysidine synthase
MYYEAVPVSALAKSVLGYIRERGLLRAGDRVGAAVSAGADSVGLLRLLLELRGELGIVLSVAHFHHGIRGAEADEDAAFVAGLASEHGLELHSACGDVPQYARDHGLSLEAAARRLRYGFFHELLRSGALTRVATGHTLDDQAETVLLRLIRGAGMRGLAGIHPLQRVELPQGGEAAIVRPLLGTRRRDLEAWLGALQQSWREDRSNLDLAHTRNRVRHTLLPLLEREFNPAIAGLLAETAELARAEEEDWQREVERAAARILAPAPAGSAALSIEPLARQPLAMQRRLVRLAAERAGLQLDFSHVAAVLKLLPGPARQATPAAHELPHGWVARRLGPELCLRQEMAPERELPRGLRGQKQRGSAARGYEHRLAVPGEVPVAELGTVLRASLVPAAGAKSEYNQEQFLDPGLLPPELVVRNWRPGDRYWPAHTKSPKKVKSLLQERRIAQPERALWPVVASGQTIVWMRGFPAAEPFRPPPDAGRVLLIEELPAE